MNHMNRLVILISVICTCCVTNSYENSSRTTDNSTAKTLYQETRFVEFAKYLETKTELSQEELYYKGRLLAAEGRYQEALQILQEVTATKNLHPQKIAGEIYYLTEQYEAAENEWMDYLSLKLDNDKKAIHDITFLSNLAHLINKSEKPERIFKQNPIHFSFLKNSLRDRRLIVEVKVGQEKALFLIDSGAPVNIIDQEFAQKISIAIDKQTVSVGEASGNKIEGRGGILPYLALNDLEYRNIPVLILDMDFINLVVRHNNIVGILSPQRLFANLSFAIDYPKEKGIVGNYDEVVSMLPPMNNKTKLYLIDGNIHIQGQFKDSPSLAFVLDLGARSTSLDADAAKYLDVDSLKYHLLNPFGYGLAIGAGGWTIARKLKSVDFIIGNTVFTRQRIGYNHFNSGTTEDNLAGLGVDFIENKVVLFDFKNFEFYMSGQNS